MMMHWAVLFSGLALVVSAGATEPGVDAVIASHLKDPALRTRAIERLRDDGITWIRERSSWPVDGAHDARPVWREAREAGLKVLGFARQVNGHLEERPEGDKRLGQDLLDVYQKSLLLASSHRGAVDAWELLNEPEFGFVADNPDAAAAFQKAMYLGLKAGDPQTPVLRPAIGGSPGMPSTLSLHPSTSYWEVSARNGLWDYGDASNLHFYGWPETLDELLQAHRRWDTHVWEQGWTRVKDAPLWITEINTYRGRFTPDRSNAEQNWEDQSAAIARMWDLAVQEDVAVFMPFILWWAKRPELSFFDQDLNALPPWEAYVAAAAAKDEGRKSVDGWQLAVGSWRWANVARPHAPEFQRRLGSEAPHAQDASRKSEDGGIRLRSSSFGVTGQGRGDRRHEASPVLRASRPSLGETTVLDGTTDRRDALRLSLSKSGNTVDGQITHEMAATPGAKATRLRAVSAVDASCYRRPACVDINDRRDAGNTVGSQRTPRSATSTSLTLDHASPPSPVVIQWVPNENTAIPNKFSGAYRFVREPDPHSLPELRRTGGGHWVPMRGELRVYNFSDEAVVGRLEWSVAGGPRSEVGGLRSEDRGLRAEDGGLRAEDGGPGVVADSNNEERGTKHAHSETLSMKPFECLTLPITFHAPVSGEARWFRGSFAAEFVVDGSRRSEVGEQKSEVGSRWSEVGEQRAEVGERTFLSVVAADEGVVLRDFDEVSRGASRTSEKDGTGSVGAIDRRDAGHTMLRPPKFRLQTSVLPATSLRAGRRPSSAFRPPSSVHHSPRSLLYFNLEASPEWDLFDALPLSIDLENTTPVRARDPGVLMTPATWLANDGNSLPRWVGEREGPDLWTWEAVVERGRGSIPVETAGRGPSKSESTTIEELRTRNEEHREAAFQPISVTPAGALDLYHRDYPFGYEWTSQAGVWSGINGLRLESVVAQKGLFQVLEVTVDPLEHEKKFPRAVVRVASGLPADAVIGLRASREFTEAPFNIAVFLVDRRGQAWRVDEQIRWHAHLKSRDKFLPVSDFVHSYFSTLIPGVGLRAEDIVEIQLDFPRRRYEHPITVAVGVLAPK